MYNEFGDTIRNRRVELILTLKELSEITNFSIPYLSDIENNRKTPSNNKTLKILSNALNINLEYLKYISNKTNLIILLSKYTDDDLKIKEIIKILDYKD